MSVNRCGCKTIIKRAIERLTNIHWLVCSKYWALSTRKWSWSLQQEASTSICREFSLLEALIVVSVAFDWPFKLALSSPYFIATYISSKIVGSTVILLMVWRHLSSLSSLGRSSNAFHHFTSFLNLLLVAQILHFKRQLCLVLGFCTSMNLLLLFHTLWRVVVLHHLSLELG